MFPSLASKSLFFLFFFFAFTEEFFHHPFLQTSSPAKKCNNDSVLCFDSGRVVTGGFYLSLQLQCSLTQVQLQLVPLVAPPRPIWPPLRWVFFTVLYTHSSLTGACYMTPLKFTFSAKNHTRKKNCIFRIAGDSPLILCCVFVYALSAFWRRI